MGLIVLLFFSLFFRMFSMFFRFVRALCLLALSRLVGKLGSRQKPRDPLQIITSWIYTPSFCTASLLAKRRGRQAREKNNTQITLWGKLGEEKIYCPGRLSQSNTVLGRLRNNEDTKEIKNEST